MPLYLHENRQETQARVPHYDFFFASLDNFRIHQRPWLLSRQSQENHAPIRANLRRGDAPPIPRRLSPIRQRVCEILHQRPNRRCRRIFHLLRFPCLRVLCVKSPPVFPTCQIPPHGTPPQSPPYSQSHLPAAPEPRSPRESPARTRLLARYIGCKSESFASLLRCPGRLSRHQQEFRTACRSAH